MPFIFNDEKYKIIDDDEAFDKTKFVVVRKLFIKVSRSSSLESIKDHNTEAVLRKYFQKFGEIESIELLVDDAAKTYVTFADNYSACLAFLYYKDDMRDDAPEYYFYVEPAYTWHQPYTNTNDIASAQVFDEKNLSSPILTLNDESLLALFRHCDIETLPHLSEVCKKFMSILNGDIFPQIKSLEINLSHSSPSLITLGQMRKVLRSVGPYINQLKFVWKIHQYNTYLMVPYLKEIVKYVGQNIRHLHFTICCEGLNLGESVFDTLKPIGERLNKLCVDYECGFHENYEILNGIEHFAELRELSLYVHPYHFPRREQIVGFAKELVFLEFFKLHGMEIEDTTIVEFIQCATKLKIVAFEKCLVSITKTFLEDIANARKQNQHLQQDEPLELVVDHHDLEANTVEEFQKYLLVRIRD